MEIIGWIRQKSYQNSNNNSMHRSADEKSGVKIIHRKSSVGWVAKVESRTPSMSGFVLSKYLALSHRGEEEDIICTVCNDYRDIT